MITKDKVEAVYPLSPMQQGMLFHTAEAPAAGYYISQRDCILQGHLDAPSFRRAWQTAMERHDVLRTAFPSLSKKVQIVFRSVGVPLTMEDWRDCAPPLQQRRLQEKLEEELRRGFDVSKAPLFRLFVAQIADTAHYFVCSSHHALLDGWSYALLLREVALLYAAYSEGRDLKLPKAPKYSEYIAWLQRQDVEAAKIFWQRTLSGVSETTTLPFDGNSKADASDARSQERVKLSPEFTHSLTTLARYIATGRLGACTWPP
jgi:surfactin family lipopeptide synthetase C